MIDKSFTIYRSVIARCFYGYCLFWFLVRFFCKAFPSQLQSPVLTITGYDFTLAFCKFSGLAPILTSGGFFSQFFTVFFFAVLILLILFPKKNKLSIVFTFFLILHAALFNLYLTHSAHYLVAMTFISCAFWSKKYCTFDLLWQGGRYYACWVYTSAFFYKLIYGSAWQWQAGVLTFKNNLVHYLFLNPNSNLASVYYWFLQHAFLLNIGHKLVIITEGLFIFGFFTKRFDRLLIFCTLFIFSSIYYFADVFFVEQLVLILTLLSLKNWQYLSNKISFLNLEFGVTKTKGNTKSTYKIDQPLSKISKSLR